LEGVFFCPLARPRDLCGLASTVQPRYALDTIILDDGSPMSAQALAKAAADGTLR